MDNVIIYDKLEELNEGIEYNGGSISSLQQDTAALLAKGVVKSVQRGAAMVSTSSSSDRKTATIQINTIDPARSWLWIDVGNNSSPHASVGYYSSSLSANTITVSFGQTSYEYLIRWQVIEFY